MTAHGTAEYAMTALRGAADEFLGRPLVSRVLTIGACGSPSSAVPETTASGGATGQPETRGVIVMG